MRGMLQSVRDPGLAERQRYAFATAFSVFSAVVAVMKLAAIGTVHVPNSQDGSFRRVLIDLGWVLLVVLLTEVVRRILRVTPRAVWFAFAMSFAGFQTAFGQSARLASSREGCLRGEPEACYWFSRAVGGELGVVIQRRACHLGHRLSCDLLQEEVRSGSTRDRYSIG